MNKIVLFSNIKGGVGKTTTSAHFTEYLTEKGFPAIAVDADLQASLSRHRERELEADPEHPIPWEIIKLNTLDASKLKADMKRLIKLLRQTLANKSSMVLQAQESRIVLRNN